MQQFFSAEQIFEIYAVAVAKEGLCSFRGWSLGDISTLMRSFMLEPYCYCYGIYFENLFSEKESLYINYLVAVQSHGII
jgi:hypothetical protein